MPWKPRRCRERGSGDCSKDGHTPAMGRMIAPSGLLAKSSGAAHTRANEDSPGVRRERGRARPMIPASRAPPWSRSGALSKPSEQAVDAVFDVVEHRLEALRAAVIRIGHLLGVVPRGEVHQSHNLVTMLGRTIGHQLSHVGVVHGHDPLEAREIASLDASRAQGAQVVTATLGRRLRASVGRMTDVIAVRARRIDLDQIAQPGFGQTVTKDAIGTG